ncbi:MAG: hypothetical protein M0R16_11795 [Bacteroidales bacterium]|jgi:hypothetical protein|nr:hypothetical protein [Bacteroidales bacterium]
MKRIKQIPYYLLLFAMFSCGNSNSDNENRGEGKEDSETDGKLNTELPPGVTTDALEKAKNDGKAVFLVITGTGATGVEQATANVNDANSRLSNSLVYSLNRDKSENNELVNKFGISTVPLPFILVISRLGIPVAGGQPAQMTAEQIIKSIPSPKQDEVYIALNEKRPVFIIISQKKFSDKEDALANCKKASERNNTKPAIVEIDFDDQGEKAFLGQIGINSMNGSTIVSVSNAAGQITGTFTTKPTVNQLNTAANKVIQKSGCAPGSGCTPGSKGCG